MNYVKGRTSRKSVIYKADPDAKYETEIVIDVSDIGPQVAWPHTPDNVKPVSESGSVKLDQVFIGSCTNGRLEDLVQAAEILKGRKKADGLRLIVIPGSQLIYKQAIQQGIIETFLDAGATIGPPTCGPCLGGHMGILTKGEKCASTSNRNFLGRMGDIGSEVYLVGPAVAAASAILGRIGSPEEL